MDRFEMSEKAKELWEQRNDVINQRLAHGQEFGMDETYQQMQVEINRLGDMAESYEHGVVPDVDAECTCGPNPDAPACPACRARADLRDIPFEPVSERHEWTAEEILRREG